MNSTILKPVIAARMHPKSPPRFEPLPVARTRVYRERNGRLLLILLALISVGCSGEAYVCSADLATLEAGEACWTDEHVPVLVYNDIQAGIVCDEAARLTERNGQAIVYCSYQERYGDWMTLGPFSSGADIVLPDLYVDGQLSLAARAEWLAGVIESYWEHVL